MVPGPGTTCSTISLSCPTGELSPELEALFTMLMKPSNELVLPVAKRKLAPKSVLVQVKFK